jgi:hypothetical protein
MTESKSDHFSFGLPLDQKNTDTVSYVGSAVIAGVVDIKPADPIEGVLAAQLVVAQEAALALYRRAWVQPPEYFEAQIKYLAQGDKDATAMMLTERLDNHRNQGKQQIIVQHTTTVNANQAVVSDSVVTGKNNETASSAKLLAATTTEGSMEILETEKQNETVPAWRGVGKAK